MTNFRRSLRFRICHFSGTIEQLLLNRRIKTLRDQEERKRKREQKEESTAHQTNGDDADLEKPRAFRRVVLAQGHLFDSKFVNLAIDEIEKRGHFEILNFFVVPNHVDMQRESQMTLAISTDTAEGLGSLYEDLTQLGGGLGVRLMEPSHETFLGGGSTYGGEDSISSAANLPSLSPSSSSSSSSSAAHAGAAASVKGSRRVLLLGAGLVAAPLVDYLTHSGREKRLSSNASTALRHVTVVSDALDAAQQLAARAPGAATAVQLEVANLARYVRASERATHFGLLVYKEISRRGWFDSPSDVCLQYAVNTSTLSISLHDQMNTTERAIRRRAASWTLSSPRRTWW